MANKPKRASFLKWMNPVLEALRAFDGSAKPREIGFWIAEKYKVSEQVLNERYAKSGQLKFQNQLAWCRQYLVWEGLLESSKHGVWTITAKGKQTNLEEDESYAIFLKWVKIFQELRESKVTKNITQEAERDADVQDGNEQEIIASSIQPTLLEILQNISPGGFEQLCGRLLKEYDFENLEITPISHDGGIDGHGTLKINPFVGISVSFQCKRYKGTVPTSDVREFIGAIESNERRFEKGLFITTGSFAQDALRIEKSNNKIELVDGEKLVEMFEKVELGVNRMVVFEPDMKFFEDYRK